VRNWAARDTRKQQRVGLMIERPFTSDVGPSRHFAAMQRFSPTWSKAEINWPAKPAASVENDFFNSAH
jgi:hypothetical protein